MTNEVPKTQQDYLNEIGALRTRINQLEVEKQGRQRLRSLDSLTASNVLDHLPDFVYVKDLNSRLVFDNVTHAQSLGIENPADLVGKTDFDFFPPEYAIQFLKDDQQIIQSGQPLLNREERSMGADGQTIWALTSKVPLRDEDGRLIGLLGITRDISQRRAIQEKLVEREAEYRREEALKNFLADASHDLNTPLAVAKTSVYLLRRLITAQHPIDEQLKYVDMLAARIEHLRKHLDDMFTLVRLDLESNFEFQLQDVNAFVQGINARYASAVSVKQQTLKLDLTPDLPAVLIDVKELQHAIDSLLDNAIAYTPPEGVITIRTLKRDMHIIIEVEDTGIGIAEEHLPHIFDRFYRVDNARNTELGRFGLGLTIAEKIVEAHDGVILVKSQPDKGSVFSICLPLPSTLTEV